MSRERPLMIPVRVLGITEYGSDEGYALILEELSSERRKLPIIIGYPEGRSIAMELQKFKTSRPITHDLISNIISELETKIIKVVVSDLRENTFYSVITIENGSGSIEVDARPSDSIALALRAKTPIFVESSVMEKAGVSEKLIQKKVDKELKVEDLREKLEEAVKNEEYEEAARLRDEIDRLSR